MPRSLSPNVTSRSKRDDSPLDGNPYVFKGDAKGRFLQNFAKRKVRLDEVMDANSLPRVKMPNRDNFIVWDQDKIEYDPIRMGAPR